MLTEFEIYCDEELVASVSGSGDRPLNEVNNYVQQYMQDGVVKVYKVDRTLVGTFAREASFRVSPNSQEAP